MAKGRHNGRSPIKALPELAVLVTCDGISRDPNTRKPTLYGIFDKIFVDAVPAKVQFNVYARMWGGAGKQTATIEFISPSGSTVTGGAPKVPFDAKPNAFYEIQMLAVGFELPKFGEYRLQLKCGEQTIGTVPLYVVKKAKK